MTKMYLNIPIYPQMSEASLISIKILLDFCSKVYTYQLFRLPNCHHIKQILLVCLKKNKNVQPKEQLKDNFIQIEKVIPKLFNHLLTQQIACNYSIDLADRVEPIENVRSAQKFSRNILTQKKKKILEKTKKY